MMIRLGRRPPRPHSRTWHEWWAWYPVLARDADGTRLLWLRRVWRRQLGGEEVAWYSYTFHTPANRDPDGYE